MKMPTKREWALIALVPLVILFAVVGPGGQDDAVEVAEVTQADRPNAAVRRTADAGELDLAQLRRKANAAEPGNAFQTKSWFAPPPPP
jgi:hypothetical protein